MNKTNNLLIATVVPLAYAAYKYCNDAAFKNKVDTTLNKSADCLNKTANKLSHKFTASEESVKDFFKDQYERLNLSDVQIKDIEKILKSKFEDTSAEIKKLLTEDQKTILSSVKKH